LTNIYRLLFLLCPTFFGVLGQHLAGSQRGNYNWIFVAVLFKKKKMGENIHERKRGNETKLNWIDRLTCKNIIT
jgi:hypothetical protein